MRLNFVYDTYNLLNVVIFFPFSTYKTVCKENIILSDPIYFIKILFIL